MYIKRILAFVTLFLLWARTPWVLLTFTPPFVPCNLIFPRKNTFNEDEDEDGEADLFFRRFFNTVLLTDWRESMDGQRKYKAPCGHIFQIPRWRFVLIRNYKISYPDLFSNTYIRIHEKSILWYWSGKGSEEGCELPLIWIASSTGSSILSTFPTRRKKAIRYSHPLIVVRGTIITISRSFQRMLLLLLLLISSISTRSRLLRVEYTLEEFDEEDG